MLGISKCPADPCLMFTFGIIFILMLYYYTLWCNDVGPQEVFLVGLRPSGIIREDFLFSWEADGINRLWLLTVILNKSFQDLGPHSQKVHYRERGENTTPTSSLVKATVFRDYTRLASLHIRFKHWLSSTNARGRGVSLLWKNCWVLRRNPLWPTSEGVLRTLNHQGQQQRDEAGPETAEYCLACYLWESKSSVKSFNWPLSPVCSMSLWFESIIEV